MNCDELTAALEKTLIHERDAHWLQAVREHAEACPSCARLLELHRLEEDLTALPAIEPSGVLLETVMSRIAQRKRSAVPSSRHRLLDLLRFAAILVGALLLAAAYLIPGAGEPWLSGLRLEPGPLRNFGLAAYLDQHPPWAIYLAGLAALLIVLGLAVHEDPVREFVRPQPNPGDSPCAPA